MPEATLIWYAQISALARTVVIELLVCFSVDNSEWVRNGDYTPDRFRAQVDAVNLVIQSKSNAHIENTLALLSYATETPKVHATLTTDVAKLLTALSSVKVGGQPKFMAGIQVAQVREDC